MKIGQALWPPLLLSIALHVGVFGLSNREQPAKATPNPSPIDVSITGKVNPPGNSRVAVGLASEKHALLLGTESATATNSENTAEALDSYAALVRERIGQSLQYPLSLQRRGVTGRVGLRLTLDSHGRVQGQEITERTGGPGSHALDELALAAVREAEPFPEPPFRLKGSGSIVLNLPVDFKLRR